METKIKIKNHHIFLKTTVFWGVLIVLANLLFSCVISNNETIVDKNQNGRNDTWGYVGAGGGGAMFHPTVSPHNPDFVFVSCDMSGSYVTYDGGESWRMFNLRGPIDYYVFDPLDPNTVYANSIALFKSTDKGNTWGVLYPSPNEITGIVSKGDHAQEIIITKDSTDRKVLAFTIDPNNSQKLYTAISINKSAACYISNDGGLHWIKEAELEEGVRDIFIVPSSAKEDRTIYITGKNSITSREKGIWKTNKGPRDVQFVTKYSGGFNKKENKFIIYAISGKGYFNVKDETSGIFRTEDGGRTWENMQKGLVRFSINDSEFPEWRSIATSSLHPEVIYVSYNNLRVHKDTTCIGIAKSEDYGKTWDLLWKDNLTKHENTPSANFQSGWINERFGPTWGENPFSIGLSPSNPDFAYTSDFGRIIKTTNGGKTWQQLYTKKKKGAGWMSRGLEVTTGYAVVFDPFNTKHVFLLYTDTGLMKSKDGGLSWSNATKDNGIPNSWKNSTYWLCFDPEIKGRVWAVMSGSHDLPRSKMWKKHGISKFKGGILMSENGGSTWKPISTDIGEAAYTHIIIDPNSNKERRTLYTCAFGKGVYKSIDGGKSWQQKNKGIKSKEPFAWRIIRRKQDGVLFLIQSRRSDDGSIENEKDGAVYRSDDNAESWVELKLPPESNAPTSLVIDPFNPNHILLSAWGRATSGKYTPDIGGGIFLSKDEGNSWTSVLNKDQHIHDITYDQRNKNYYACGFNGSAYISINKGESWERIKGYNFKWGKRVDFDPRNPDEIYIITFGGGIWYGPADGDKKSTEDIITPILTY